MQHSSFGRAKAARYKARASGVCLFLFSLTGCVGGDAPADPYETVQKAGSGGSKTAADGGSGGTGGGAANGTGGSGGSPGGARQAGAKDSHFPLADGASWTYHHEYPQNPGKMPWDEVANMRATTYMGMPGFILEDEEDAKGERTASTMLVDGTAVQRVYKEVRVGDALAFTTTYDPGFMRYDEAWLNVDDLAEQTYESVQTCVMASTASKCAPGAIKKNTTTHSFKVISLSTSVTVPAGTFDTIEIERVNLGDPATTGDEESKLFWYAAGVGKVREEDMADGATEELSSYDIP